jgi:hypothetical protein
MHIYFSFKKKNEIKKLGDGGQLTEGQLSGGLLSGGLLS